jgi:hypothetical protein
LGAKTETGYDLFLGLVVETRDAGTALRRSRQEFRSSKNATTREFLADGFFFFENLRFKPEAIPQLLRESQRTLGPLSSPHDADLRHFRGLFFDPQEACIQSDCA